MRGTAAAAGADANSVAVGTASRTDTGGTAATAIDGLPARTLFLDSRAGDVGGVAGSAEFAAGRLAGGRGRPNARRGRRWTSPLSPRLSASVPLWHGGGGGAGGSAERLRPPSRAGRRGGAWEEEDDEAVEGEGNGDGGVDVDVDMDGALVVVSAAAMDVLRGLEHMHVGDEWFGRYDVWPRARCDHT